MGARAKIERVNFEPRTKDSMSSENGDIKKWETRGNFQGTIPNPHTRLRRTATYIQAGNIGWPQTEINHLVEYNPKVQWISLPFCIDFASYV